MNKIIKSIGQQLAIAIFAALMVVNIQIGKSDYDIKSNAMEISAHVEEAYAGPCGRRGCEGNSGDCGEAHTVLEIGGIEITRHCKGSKASQQPT